MCSHACTRIRDAWAGSAHHHGKDEGRNEADEGREVEVDEADDHHADCEASVVVGATDHQYCRSRDSRLPNHHHILQIYYT